MKKGIVHINNPAGHRQAYLDLFVSITGLTPLISPISRQNFGQLVKADRVLFATVGFAFKRFLAVSFLRAFLRKPTCALFIGATRYRGAGHLPVSFLDRVLLKIWKLLPKQTIFAIIPYGVEPTLSQVTSDYVYDPQMWDIWLDNAPTQFPQTPLSDQVERERQGRKVLIFIGKGNKRKSFGELAQFAEVNKDQFYVVAAGKTDPECAAAAEKLRALNMIVENRFISDEELMSLYGIADYAWCFYAPDYDQASGIFGRAIQFGVRPVIRSGSVIARIAEQLNIASLKLTTEDLTNEVELEDKESSFQNQELSLAERKSLFSKLRDDSLEKLNQALH